MTRNFPSIPQRRHVTSFMIIHVGLLVLALLASTAAAAPNCLRFADHNSINQAFSDGGAGAKVFLCPSKTYRLSGTIFFTAADQELATYGYPTGAERAVVVVNGDIATAIQGDCRRCARVGISSLVVDGNRANLGRIANAGLATGLIVLGNNEGQSVRQSHIFDPRGFTAIHIREGDKLACKKAVIEKNDIGPVGEEFDESVDGPDPEGSPLGRPLADGVSIACRDSIVRDNTFTDNTDAAVVIYGSPGSTVSGNIIRTERLSQMAGILMVDSTPFDGDYSGLTVKNNIIDAASRMIRVGIGIGPAVWSDDTDTVLKGGSVIGNGIRGKYMGYGIAAAGLDGWTVKDNWDKAGHGGKKSSRCFDEPVNPSPMAFLRNPDLIKNSDFQPGFHDAPFEYVVCIDEETDLRDKVGKTAPKPQAAGKPVEPPKNNEVRGETAAPPAAPSEATPMEGFDTGSEMMDEILEHSQTRMLETIDMLSRRVDALAHSVDLSKGPADIKHKGQVVMSPQIAVSLGELQDRVNKAEVRQKSMLEKAVAMRSALNSWDLEMTGITEWQDDLLLDIQHRLNLFMAAPASADHIDHVDHDHAHIDAISHQARLMNGLTGGGLPWPVEMLKWIFLLAILVLAWILGKRWWSNTSHRKVL